MRLLWAGVALCAMAGNAWALEEPVPGKKDPRICTVAYRPDDVVDVKARMGDTITLVFGQGEVQGGTAFSDTVTIKRVAVANVLWLKATGDMPTQPIAIRTEKPDGTPHLYMIQWQTADAACYEIRFTYAGEIDAAKRAAWLKQRAEERARAAEAALATPAPPAVLNYRYSVQGDARLLPQEARR